MAAPEKCLRSRYRYLGIDEKGSPYAETIA
jgi:hypothetical protein